MEDVHVVHLELLGFEKRLVPSQHYVYLLMVKWSDQTEKLIYRSYPEIHTFHKHLKEMFPIESGLIERKDRIIPNLPAPRWLDSERRTETRQSTLSEYCSTLITLPTHISRSSLIKTFFAVRRADENPPAPNGKQIETFVPSSDTSLVSEISGPILLETYRVVADFKTSTNNEMELKTGDMVDIVEKSPNGWWFCLLGSRRGWVPASYLEPLEGPEESEEPEPNYAGEQYVSSRTYEAQNEDEISLDSGESVEVIHQLLDGWWVVRRGEDTGHFPSMFLRKVGQKAEPNPIAPQKNTPPPRRSSIRNVQSIHRRKGRRLSQADYRRRSQVYVQMRRMSTGLTLDSPLQEISSTEEEDPEQLRSSVNSSTPTVPPRPGTSYVPSDQQRPGTSYVPSDQQRPGTSQEEDPEQVRSFSVKSSTPTVPPRPGTSYVPSDQQKPGGTSYVPSDQQRPGTSYVPSDQQKPGGTSYVPSDQQRPGTSYVPTDQQRPGASYVPSEQQKPGGTSYVPSDQQRPGASPVAAVRRHRQSSTPAVPPRPGADLILERCSDKTRSKLQQSVPSNTSQS